ncbi:YolD-like family protein [Neobacillus sp. PS2-9]|uniref:YolD-like family protein n=1 Tax=Neobacillus sp. PS2-9 TaxID=3070676 RepID=UPI0027E1176A|nr:YolD-like family protein [Neobacillus sp. PS2-9]WML55966.1 YolD-like family protein [Neobacillus sp. PS2-9]
MFLKKLTENKQITIDYYTNGNLQTIKGRVHRLNLMEQLLSLKDDQQKSFTIRLSCIRQIH